MAISNTPETTATATVTTIQTDTDLKHSSLRRRPSATSTAGGLFDAESAAADAVRDSASDDSLNGKINNEEEVKDRKTDHAEGIDEDDNVVKKNGGNDVITDRENENVAVDFKFTYRPSVPAHRRIKESPLSSGNIFRQVGFEVLVVVDISFAWLVSCLVIHLINDKPNLLM